MSQPPQPYKVRSIRVVVKGADVLVREYTLDPGELNVSNPGTTACRFLLIQGVGQYDFVKEE